MREFETSPSEIERFLICPGCANEGNRMRGAYSEPISKGIFIHEVVEQAVDWKRRSTGSTLAQLKNSRHGENRALHAFAIDDARPTLIPMANNARGAFLRFIGDCNLDPVGESEGEYTIEFNDSVKLVGRCDIRLNAGRRKYVVDLKMAVDLQDLGDNVQMAVAMLGLGRTPVLFDASSFVAYQGGWNKKWLEPRVEEIVLGVTELKRLHYSAHWCGRGDIGRGMFVGMEIVSGESPIDKLAQLIKEIANTIVSESKWEVMWSG